MSEMVEGRDRADTYPKEAASSAPGLEDVVLTDAEQAIFTSEFVREAVASAIDAVRQIEAQRSVGISRLLGMRDLLFATWLGRTFDIDANSLMALESDMEAVVREVDTRAELPDSVTVVKRVTEFAAEQDMPIGEYLRFVDAYGRFKPLSGQTTDDQLRELMDFLTTECVRCD
jgi:hypothetical protein